MRLGQALGPWLVVLTVALTGAVPAVLVAAGVRDVLWIAILTAIAALTAPVGKVLTDKLTRAQIRKEDSAGQLVTQALGGGQYRMSAVSDATLLGVHPAILCDEHLLPAETTTEKLPVYIRRDRHDEIVEHLGPGNFVIVLGDSAAGKTRAAFEAVAMTLPDHYVMAPQRREDLPSAIDAAITERKSVLWLDDLERFIGAGGLTVAAIDRVLSGNKHHRVIMATMRSEELHSLDLAHLDRQLGAEQQRVLEQATQVRLDRKFSPAELARADPVRWDPRIDDALLHANDYGVAEYLAAAPRLLENWRDAWAPGTRPRGAALVQAAIECRRAGYLSPLPTTLVEKLHVEFLEERGGARLRPEDLAEAWRWATSPKHNTTTSLLEYTDAGHVVVFDYLVDHLQHATGPDSAARRSVVEAALTESDTSTSHDIARTAYRQGQYDLARIAFERTIELQTAEDGPDAVEALTSRSELARVLARLGNLETAVAEHRSVLDARTRVLGPEHPDTLSTRNYLARTLDKQGKLDLAAAEFRAVLEARTRALGAEHPDTLNSRGSLAGALARQGELELAGAELRAVLAKRIQVIGPDHPYTLLTRNDIARLLVTQQKLTEATTEYRSVIAARTRVLGANHPETLDSRHELATTLILRGELRPAETELHKVVTARTKLLGTQHPDTILSRTALTQLRARKR